MNISFSSRKKQGVALVMVLVVLLLTTILVVTLAVLVLNENKMARLTYNSQQAQLLCELALDTAEDTIATGLNQFDDPFTANAPATNFWSLAPGRIDIYPLRSGNLRPVSSNRINLYSGAPFDAQGNALDPDKLVDLDAATASGNRPIDSDLPAAQKMNVAWVPVLSDPSAVASASNTIIGRYAYWVDDEGAKVNINTADGTEKNTAGPNGGTQPYEGALSYGMGTPSEVSLTALGSPLGTDASNASTLVSAIADRARNGAFALPGEILQIPGVPVTFQTANNFNLTTYSRSPEFNIFNEPRLQLAPTNMNKLDGTTDPAYGSYNKMFFPSMVNPSGVSSMPGNFLSRTLVRSVYPSPQQISNNLKGVWPILPAADIASGRMGTALIKISKLQPAPDSDAAAWVAFENQTDTADYASVANVTAKYLTGIDAKGNTVQWPFAQPFFCDPSNPSAASNKYNLRQVDSITIQALDLARASMAIDIYNPTTACYGILQDRPVVGLGRCPRLTEFYGKFTLSAGKTNAAIPPVYKNSLLRGLLRVELYYPAGSFTPNHLPDLSNYTPSMGMQFESGYKNSNGISGFANIAPSISMLNGQDAPATLVGLDPPANPIPSDGSEVTSLYPSFTPPATAATASHSFWMDDLFIAKDEEGNSAGIDFWGNKSETQMPTPPNIPFPDPDQTKAALYRDPAEKDSNGQYPGRGPSGLNPSQSWPLFWFNNMVVPNNPSSNSADYHIPAGSYEVISNQAGNQLLNPDAFASDFVYPTRDAGYGGPLVQAVTLSGKLFLWLGFNVDLTWMDVAPIDSLAGPSLYYKGPPRPNYGSSSIPISVQNSYAYQPSSGFTIPPVTTDYNNTAYIHMYVKDPFVNKNVGDWVIESGNTPPSSLTMPVSTSKSFVHTVPNVGATDLAACWTTRLCAYPYPYASADSQPLTTLPFPWPNWSGQSSFPSIGPLHYIRTRMMPNTGTNPPAGTPFQCLSLAPPSSDSTQNDIPDWALLDLFTVPQGIYRVSAANSPSANPTQNYSYNKFFGGDYINLTYGGATSGKINVNGAVLYPWADSSNSTDVFSPTPRLGPLASVFKGLNYNTDGRMVFDNTTGNCTSLLGPLSTTDATTVSQAIANYIKANGPMSMPGEICDIQTLEDLYGVNVTANPTRTRNDVIAQALGNLTTQGNVFSVWVAAQAVKKIPSNTNFGIFEQGDRILAMRRAHYIIERYLDLGADGVPGNAADSGPDGAVGTFDDPVDPLNNPMNPKFKYRVIYAEDIQ